MRSAAQPPITAVHLRNPPCRHIAALPKNAYGEDDTRRWLAIQLLGPTLASLLAPHPAPWHTVAAIAVQALDALSYVHSKKYVYVDVNPDNFILGRRESLTIRIVLNAIRLRGLLQGT